jgi:hypothetical protein
MVASPRSASALVALVGAAVLSLAGLAPASGAPGDEPAPTPQLACGAGALPEEGIQGRVSKAEHDSGRAAKGYTCNTEQVGHLQGFGGFQVHRYVDDAGHECGYFDSTLLFPKDALTNAEGPGTYVLDMSDPAEPVVTATLTTPAMLSPHESLRLNQERGLLAAGMGYPSTNPGFVDVYDVTEDCRQPVLKSSTPLGIFGHESAFSPDGLTFYVTGTLAPTLTALDLTDPSVPRVVWSSVGEHMLHGMNLSADGKTLYGADAGVGKRGLTILDVTQVQERAAVPQVPVVSRTTWPTVSIPQNADPISIKGKPYLVEMDEYTSTTLNGPPGYDPNAFIGAGRMIDIADPAAPKVVSDLRLEVHQRANRATDQRSDPGASSGTQGYAGHYCSVPTRVNPTITACSMIVSGLRVFDIRNPEKPVEIAYFNRPAADGAFAMSAPTFVPERDEIWYADGNSGFYVVRLTGAARAIARGQAAPAAAPPAGAAAPPAAPASRAAPPSGGVLPSTGAAAPVAAGGLAVLGLLLVAARRRRSAA